MRALFALALLTLPSVAEAKDLRQRVGVGFNNQFSQLSSISVKYGLPAPEPTINVQAELTAGFAVLGGANDSFFLGARVLYGFLAEDNLNLYAGAGAGFLQEGEDSGVRIQPAAGVEFFFFGLENLGFSTELGVNIDLIGGNTDLFSVSGGPAVGMHYYF